MLFLPLLLLLQQILDELLVIGRIDVIRSLLQCLIVGFDGLLVFSKARQRVAFVVQCLGAVRRRFGLLRVAELGQCLLVVALSIQGATLALGRYRQFRGTLGATFRQRLGGLLIGSLPEIPPVPFPAGFGLDGFFGLRCFAVGHRLRHRRPWHAQIERQQGHAQ